MIEFLANLVSPIFVPMGVSYADLLKYLNDMGSYLLAGGIAEVHERYDEMKKNGQA